MPSPPDLAVELLDVLASDAPEPARAAARDRLARIVAEGASALEAAARSEGAEAALDSIDDRLMRGASRAGAVARRYALLGVPERHGAPPDPAAVRVGRVLLDLSAERLESIASEAGRIEAALLCRDLDDRAAGRLASRLGAERAAVRARGPLAPPPEIDLLRYSSRRLATVAGGAAGAALVRRMGRSLLADVVAWSEPEAAAALARRLACTAVARVPLAVAWAPTVERLVARRDV